MTVNEILEQAKTLSREDRKLLMKSLVDILDSPLDEEQEATKSHWGQSLNQLLDELDPIEMKYPEIDDPVEWVKHLRSEQRKRRLGDDV